MGKKAAIFTWCYDNGRANYGQVLQCYAMQELCREYGLDVTVIKYRHLERFEKPQEIPPKGEEREQYERLYKERHVERQDTGQAGRFREFISEHICQSPQCYSVKDIQEETDRMEILIVGSDQLWNPWWFDPVYALGFAKEGQRRVSIATGGISEDREAYRPFLRRLAEGIEAFDYVSVRERASKEILSRYTDKEIADVLDPTLLLNGLQWKNLCGAKLIEGSYLLVYCIGKITPHKYRLKKIAKKHGLGKIVYIKRASSSEGINAEGILEPVADVGPKEFLSLIRHADAVCTDSFHGFAFSLVFKKEFYLMDRVGISMRYSP